MTLPVGNLQEGWPNSFYREQSQTRMNPAENVRLCDCSR